MDAYIAFLTYAYSVSVALFFVGAAKLFLKTRHWAAAGFAAGTGLAFLAEVARVGAYWLSPMVWDSGGSGLVPAEPRDTVLNIALAASAIGLTVGAAAFLCYVFSSDRPPNAT